MMESSERVMAALLVVQAARSGVTKKLLRRLDAYQHVLMAGDDWLKAMSAEVYVEAFLEHPRMGYVTWACALLSGVEDPLLRAVAGSKAYSKVALLGVGCRGVDICERLRASLRALEGANALTLQFRRYVAFRYGAMPEEVAHKLLGRARTYALEGLASCALDGGAVEEAERLFAEASAEYARAGRLGDSVMARLKAVRVSALRRLEKGEGLDDLVDEFKVWEAARGNMPCPEFASLLSAEAYAFGNYLVSLALTKRREEAGRVLRGAPEGG